MITSIMEAATLTIISSTYRFAVPLPGCCAVVIACMGSCVCSLNFFRGRNRPPISSFKEAYASGSRTHFDGGNYTSMYMHDMPYRRTPFAVS